MICPLCFSIIFSTIDIPSGSTLVGTVLTTSDGNTIDLSASDPCASAVVPAVSLDCSDSVMMQACVNGTPSLIEYKDLVNIPQVLDNELVNGFVGVAETIDVLANDTGVTSVSLVAGSEVNGSVDDNGDGTFTERMNELLKIVPLFSMGSSFADVNNDGLLDIITTEMMPESHSRRKNSMVHPDVEFFNYVLKVTKRYFD